MSNPHSYTSSGHLAADVRVRKAVKESAMKPGHAELPHGEPNRDSMASEELDVSCNAHEAPAPQRGKSRPGKE